MSDRLELDLEKIKGTGRRGKRSRFELLTTQAIICVIALLAAIILKTLGGNLYDTARQNYIAHFEDETRVEEVLETIGDALGISEPDENTKESDPVSQQQSLPTSGFPSLPENSDSEPSDTSDDFPVSSDRSGTTYVATDANGQKIAESVGAHVNSIIMPVNGRITSAFGLRIHPISGDERMHGGMDIGGYEGETIGAAMAGTVSKIGEDDSFGEYVFLTHQNGMETVYAHCSKIIVEEGQQVGKGEKIAEVGSTGVSNGPHLHFEVRVGGVRINPSYLLPETGNT